MADKHRFNARLILLSAITAAGLGGLTLFSYLVDPFRLYHDVNYLPPPINLTNCIIPISNYCYVTKAKQIIRYRPEKILLGSSIVDAAFYIPGSVNRACDADLEKGKRAMAILPPDKKGFYNASIRGGGIAEADDFLHHAYLNNPKLNEVIWGIEWSAFAPNASNPATMPKAGILGKTDVPFSFDMEYLLSPLALSQASTVLDNYMSDSPSRFWRHIGRESSQLIANIKSLPSRISALFSPKPRFTPHPPSEFLLKAEGPDVISKYLFSTWFIPSLKIRADNLGKDASTEFALTHLRNAVAFCKEHHIRLRIYLSPQPPVYWAMMRKFGMDKYWEQWMRDVTAVTPVYDASELVDFAPEVDSYFPWDALHFNEYAGEKILSALVPERVPPQMIYTDSHNVESRIIWRNHAIDQWRAQHENQVRTIDAINVQEFVTLSQKPGRTDVMASLPIPYTPSYKGFTLYSYLGHYVALSKDEKPPFDFYRFTQGRYTPFITAPSLDDLIKKIDMLDK